MENGRRYRGHKEEFPWPNDDDALMSYSSLNTAWARVLEPRGQDLVSAPVVLHKGTKVLDCGARGTTWMYDIEEKYPGTRIAVVDPGLEGDWPFTARQAFHFIRGFALGGMIVDYDGLYRNAYKHLLLGGWFEVRDHDLQFFVDTPSGDADGNGKKEDTGGEEKAQELVVLRRWEKLVAKAAEKLGKQINMGAKHKEIMEKAGFVDVHEEVIKVPYGKWMEGRAWEKAGSAYLMHMRHDTKAFIEELKAEIPESKLVSLRLYSLFRVVYGKKPKGASRKPEQAAREPGDVGEAA
ncbi:hypothetical protein BJX62DRAFT_230758 [Aspergillus germanicus]